MSEGKMSAGELVERLEARAKFIDSTARYGNHAMVGPTDARLSRDAAAMISTLQREADGMRQALVEHREFWRGRAHGFMSWRAWRDLEAMTDAALHGSPQERVDD